MESEIPDPRAVTWRGYYRTRHVHVSETEEKHVSAVSRGTTGRAAATSVPSVSSLPRTRLNGEDILNCDHIIHLILFKKYIYEIIFNVWYGYSSGYLHRWAVSWWARTRRAPRSRPPGPSCRGRQQTRASLQFLTRARAGRGSIHVRSRPAVTRFLELQYCLYQVWIPAIKTW